MVVNKTQLNKNTKECFHHYINFFKPNEVKNKMKTEEMKSIPEIKSRIKKLKLAKKQIMTPIKAYHVDVALAVLKWVLNGDN